MSDDAECTNTGLEEGDLTVVFPDSVKEIHCGEHSATDCIIGTVIANKGTYAEQWAKENGIKFIPKSEFNK